LNTGSSEKGNGKTTLLMGFHCHQPVGNFHTVLRQGCAECYGPLLEELARQPGFKFGFHLSGYLLEWIRREEKGIYSLLQETSRRGQAELFTAGFYEPILSVIPPDDALEQIRLLSDTLEEISGTRPSGLWLTERIWDPGLVPLLCEAGIRYTLVDDNQILSAGQGGEGLSGYFITERMSKTLALFPISQRLRYATPFKQVPEALQAVEEAGGERGAAIIFDDGEKFGMWPGTHEWVYGRGWLRDFLSGVVESERIITGSFGDYLNNHAPLGRLHLPAGSYFEMGEWALSTEDALLFRELLADLGRTGREKAARRFLKGGLWPDFLLKYPESGNMHKKMIRVSERTRRRNIPEARRCLLRAQCNDAYWHGIFGGLYLPVLRDSVKRELILAERILDGEDGPRSPFFDDLNADGFQEAELRGKEAIVVIHSLGAQVCEISDKKSLFDLMSTLARKREHYHETPGEEGSAEGEGVATIHEAMRHMDEKTRRMLVFDRYPRYSFVDHFLPPGTGADQFAEGSFRQLGDFADSPFRLEPAGMGVRARREGRVWLSGNQDGVPVVLIKGFSLEGSLLSVRYDLSVEGPVDGEVLFASELNLHIPSGDGCPADLDGKVFPLDRVTEGGPGRVLSVQDPHLEAPIVVRASPRTPVWGFPVRTVSQSEQGFDVTCQGICLVMVWALDFSLEKRISLKLSLAF